MLDLRPRPPFRLDLTVWALRRRPQNAIDTWDGHSYRRTLLVDGAPLELTVTQRGRPDAPRLEVVLGGPPTSSAAEHCARAALARLLGLDLDLSSFYAKAATDETLRPLAERYRGLKPPRFPTVFECLLNAVACQQLSIEAGLTLLNRLAAATAGQDACTPRPFPAPEQVDELPPNDLRAAGFSERKVETILAVAHAAATGEVDLQALARLDDAAIAETLQQRRGIGPWSADYVLLRGLGRLHVFPRRDIGALNGLQRFLAATEHQEESGPTLARWAPFAGLVYFHLLLRGLDERGLLDCRAEINAIKSDINRVK